MSTRRGHVVLHALLAAVMAAGLTGCWGPGATQEEPVTRVIDEAEVRTDHEPLTSRFPRLGSSVEARWVGGALGDQRVPGPSTYFIEAVVTPAAEDVERLRAAYRLEPAAAPDLPAPLRSAVGPDPQWSGSAELDSGFGPPGWACRVWIDLASGIVYVSARGE